MQQQFRRWTRRRPLLSPPFAAAVCQRCIEEQWLGPLVLLLDAGLLSHAEAPDVLPCLLTFREKRDELEQEEEALCLRILLLCLLHWSDVPERLVVATARRLEAVDDDVLRPIVQSLLPTPQLCLGTPWLQVAWAVMAQPCDAALLAQALKTEGDAALVSALLEAQVAWLQTDLARPAAARTARRAVLALPPMHYVVLWTSCTLDAALPKWLWASAEERELLEQAHAAVTHLLQVSRGAQVCLHVCCCRRRSH